MTLGDFGLQTSSFTKKATLYRWQILSRYDVPAHLRRLDLCFYLFAQQQGNRGKTKKFNSTH